MGSSTATHGAYKGVAVTKSDATILPATRALWVGGAGDLSLVFSGDTAAVTIKAVAAGTLLPFQVIQVKAATSASDIVALY